MTPEIDQKTTDSCKGEYPCRSRLLFVSKRESLYIAISEKTDIIVLSNVMRTSLDMDSRKLVPSTGKTIGLFLMEGSDDGKGGSVSNEGNDSSLLKSG